jgi:hypothetical protein
MYERDSRVMRECREMKTPVVFNLAGGYQQEEDGSIPKVLELHRQTMKHALFFNRKDQTCTE